MAESTSEQRSRPWRTVTSITLIVLGLAAASTLAATVTQPPTISGQPADPAKFKPGVELSVASAGAWTPADAQPTYDWLRCNASGANCQGISGACGRRYTVRLADDGHKLRVRLTATQSGGEADQANSAPTGVVAHDNYFIPPVTEPDTCTKVTPTGPGRGTFSSGTQVGAGSEPSADTALRFIDPFPVVRIAGRFKGKRTTLTRVSVRAPKGARIRFDCKDRGCPYKRKALVAKLITVRSLQRTYRPKATIEVRITEPKKIGKYTRVRTRKGKAPVRIDRCLMPGKSKPVRCPSE
jgi:hypothetical protein